MKVAISGSAGTGKTTLARDDFFDERYNYIQSRSELKRRIVSLLESKHRLEQEQESFVVDRCPVDLFNLWMAQGFGDDQKSTGALYSQCRKYIEKYDRVIVLPWSAIQHHRLAPPMGGARETITDAVQCVDVNREGRLCLQSDGLWSVELWGRIPSTHSALRK
mgnify:CR=1 FL=1